MKISILSLISSGIFIGLFSIIFYNTQAENSVHEIKKQYSIYVTSACQDAFDSAYEAVGNEEEIFNETGRNAAVSTFFKSLETSFNRIGVYAEDIKLYVPALILLDRDGFYVYYNVGLDGAASSAGTFISGMTELKTWTEAVGDYVIRYELTDMVTVTKISTGEKFMGNRKDVYAQLSDSTLSFLNTDDFGDRRSSVIISETEFMTEYYVNNHNNYNAYDEKYMVDFSIISRDDWNKLLQSPTVLAFLQGKQLKEAEINIILNIYSFASTELIESLSYFIDGNNMYHCVEQLEAAGYIVYVDGERYYDGEPLGEIYDSMEACALEGAYPASLR